MMTDEQLEARLREVGAPKLHPEVKQRLLARASRRLAARRRGRMLRWGFAAAAGLLIAVNLAFGQIHDQRMAAITGRPGVQPSIGAAAYADALSQQQRLLSELMQENGNS